VAVPQLGAGGFIKVMHAGGWWRSSLAAVALVLALLLIGGRAPTQTAPPPAAPPGLEKIQHFVFIMQENRSFDHYFGTYPGAEGIPPGVCVPNPAGGACVSPFHDSNDVNQGGAHNWADALNCIDSGLMDGFIKGTAKKPGDVMGWHDSRAVGNYWDCAQLYVLQDRMFESITSYSLPAHLYMLAAQSGGYIGTGQPRPDSYAFTEITNLLRRWRSRGRKAGRRTGPGECESAAGAEGPRAACGDRDGGWSGDEYGAVGISAGGRIRRQAGVQLVSVSKKSS